MRSSILLLVTAAGMMAASPMPSPPEHCDPPCIHLDHPPAHCDHCEPPHPPAPSPPPETHKCDHPPCGHVVEPRPLAKCDGQWYDHEHYDCYPGGKLCPKLNGHAMLPCGPDCYSPFQYTCHNDKIEQIPIYDKAFTLTAHNPRALPIPDDKKVVQACGRHFWLKDHGPCSHCPEQVLKSGACPPGNTTAFIGSRGMDAVVPGGQYYYVEPNGAFGFTQAHSGSIPPNSIVALDVHENGAFLVLNTPGWMACPTMEEGKHFQIFAQLETVHYPPECIPITLLVKPYLGAPVWQYV